jgi:hypothetical protein
MRRKDITHTHTHTGEEERHEEEELRLQWARLARCTYISMWDNHNYISENVKSDGVENNVVLLEEIPETIRYE